MLSKALTLASAFTSGALAFQQMDAPFLGDQTTPDELISIDQVGKMPCVFKLGDAFYDFTPIRLAYPNPQIPYLNGQPIPEKLLPLSKYWFLFGWCQDLSDVEGQSACAEDIFAGRVDFNPLQPMPQPSDKCTAYSGGDYSNIETELITGQPLTKERMAAGDTSTLNGVKLQYTGGSTCPETGMPTTFTLNMYCNASMEKTAFDYSQGALGNYCTPYVDTVSWAACERLSVSQLWGYLAKYSDYFGAFLLIAGFLLVFAGRSLLKPAVCCAGFLTTIVLSCLIYYSVYLNDTSDLSEFWYFLGGGAAVGICVGLLMCWAMRVGAAVLAGWGGVCAGLILNETLVYRAGMEWLFWVTLVVCALGAAITVFFILDEMVITSTALLGSYCLVRGTACYAGHYYNEVTMAKMMEENLLDDIDPWYWAYVGGFVLMVALGMLVQCSGYKKEKAMKRAKNHPYHTNASSNGSP